MTDYLKVDVNSMPDVTIAADLGTLNIASLPTAAQTDLDNIAARLATLLLAITSNKVQTDVKTLPGTAQADIATLAGAIASGSIKAVLQAGTAAIGKLAANAGVNVGTVDVATLPSLVLSAGSAAIGKLAANAGVNVGTVDVATLPSLVLAAGSAAIGKLAANAGVNIGTVDVATLPSLVLAAGTAAIGKLAANSGVVIGDVNIVTYAPYIDAVTAADTNAHAYGTSQATKAPAFIRVARTTTGTVTLTDGTRANGMILNAGDTTPVHVTNLNQITYQFSVNATTEKFFISAGI